MPRAVTWLLALATSVVVAPAADLAEIRAGGKLRVVAQKDEAPEMFRFSGAGEPGFEREMIEGFARIHRLSVVPVSVATSGDRIGALTRGEGDVIIGIVDTAERRRLVAFTGEVLPARHLVVTHAPHPVVRSVEAFRAERVGVVKNTSWAQAAVGAGVSLEAMTLFPERGAMLAALQEGRITATVMTTTDFLLATRSHAGLQGGVVLGEPASAGWAVRREDTQLLAALEEYVSNFRAGPSWSRLIVKYFGDKALAALGRE
jgi:ABC-type amino acid transport substrate-binding protein